jgi:hypothetical protein
MSALAPLEILTRYFSGGGISDFRTPHLFDGRACSTNGQWFAVLDTVPESAELPTMYGVGDYKPHGILAAIDAYTGEFVPASAIGIRADSCMTCRGTGTVTETDCGDCHGDGWFRHGSHQYECKNCDGSGVITRPGKGDTCSDCFGTGAGGREWPSTHADTLLQLAASSFYIAALRAIGGEISARPFVNPDEPLGIGPLWILRFPGGRGVLMPMHKTLPLSLQNSDLAPPATTAEGSAA